MKKMIKSLAAISVLLAAALFASCSKSPAPEIQSGKVVTITIAPPSAEDTKVAITDNVGTKVSITGWELSDKVTMVAIVSNNLVSSEFTCIDADLGTFSGSLPAGVSDVSELKYATYNAQPFKYYSTYNCIDFFPTTICSSELKDVIVMAGANDGSGSFQMKVCGNILKVTNNLPAFDCAFSLPGYGLYSSCVSISTLDDSMVEDYYSADSFDDVKFTLPAGVSYLYLPMNNNYGLGASFVDDSNTIVIPPKNTADNSVIYTKTIDPLPVASYDDFLGKWKMNSSSYGTIEFTVEKKVDGTSYTIKNFLSKSDGTAMFDGGVKDVEALFDSSKKCLTVSEQYLISYSDSYGDWNDYLTGFFIYGTSLYLNYPIETATPDVLFDAVLQSDGNVTLNPGSCAYGTFYSVAGSWVSTINSTNYGSYSTAYMLPNLWTKVTGISSVAQTPSTNYIADRTPKSGKKGTNGKISLPKIGK